MVLKSHEQNMACNLHRTALTHSHICVETTDPIRLYGSIQLPSATTVCYIILKVFNIYIIYVMFVGFLPRTVCLLTSLCVCLQRLSFPTPASRQVYQLQRENSSLISARHLNILPTLMVTQLNARCSRHALFLRCSLVMNDVSINPTAY